MSRSAHQRQHQQQQLLAQQQQQQQMADNEAAAAAAEMFDLFCLASTMRQVLGLHRSMCDTVGLRPAPLNEFYPKLKAKIHSWKAQALWKKFDARAAHRAYAKGNACSGTRVLVIGAGPCGLRTAIEAQLLGAKVVVIEKRDRISRNNVLHLWPFVITDLRNLGAKKFYGKFCAGSIDHISIRQLQCILLKVALLLGVEVHEGVSFESTIEPSEGCGWRAHVTPEDHAVSHYEFDVLIGADGKRNTLEGFRRKEFRGKLAIAITANFINKKTEAEAKAEEISGVAFIFNQSFFKELYHTTGIDLENIVYYKDETHYFVMTAKKHSLIDKGVIMQDFADPAELLAPANVNTEKLLDYAREAAEFSTKYQMPNLEFAVNHYGKPDVAMFDFTSMFAAETSCRVIVRKNYRLLQCLVGDSLLEPFWPTGSGCARGFLSSMDSAYAIKLWSNTRNSTLGVLAQRESIYRLLAQTTPENLQRDIGSYTVDPATRYPNLNRTSVNVWQVKHLIDTDDKSILEQTFMDTNAIQNSQGETPVRRKRRSGDSVPLSTVLLRWVSAQLHSYEFTKNLKEVSDCFTNGKVLCALINRYRPDLVDFNAVKDLTPIECNEIAFKILDKELHIPRIMSGKDSIHLDSIESKVWLNYLEQICEVFRGEIPHVKHPKLDVAELREKNRNAAPDFSKLLQISSLRKAKTPLQDTVDVPNVVQRRSVLDEDKVKRQRKHETAGSGGGGVGVGQQAQVETPRRAKKRRSAEKAANIEERQQRLREIEENRQDRQSKRRQQRYQQTQNFYKSLHMLHANTLLRESGDETSPFEDYSIYMYRQQAPIFNDRVKELERKLLYPDRERGIPSALPRGADEQFSDRIKSMEQRITSRNAYGTDKKPKDLMRAIGKIDSSDWNVREIERKIEASKKTEIPAGGPKGREKVPKWSKEQFVARQTKMSKPIRQDSGEEKFKEIDQTLKNLDKQLKEGNILEVGERGRNKVASIAGQFVKKDDTSEEKNTPPTVVPPKSSSKVALAFKKQAASEKCHFCKQTVYLMEKISTENLILHRSCLKCHHCHTNLRLGGYAFDRDDPTGRFYCTQHFRLPAKAIRPVVRKPGHRKSSQQQAATAAAAAAATIVDSKTPEKPRGRADNIAQLDLLDRGQTPERIEFENTDAMSDGEPSEEHIIDENEWSGRNFLPQSDDSGSDLSSSDESDDESDSEIFEEANGSPIAAQTLQLATDWIGKQHYSNSDDSDDDFYDSSEGLIDDEKDDTDGEEFKKAREMRREEVRLLPLPANLPTDTETELVLVDENKKQQQLQVESTKANAADFTEKSSNSPGTGFTTKADMEKLEQNSDNKFSAEIEAISAKLYRLNSVMKMNRDIESLAKENLVKSDILKKLSLKEKWLQNNNVGSTASLVVGGCAAACVDVLSKKPELILPVESCLVPSVVDAIEINGITENLGVQQSQEGCAKGTGDGEIRPREGTSSRKNSLIESSAVEKSPEKIVVEQKSSPPSRTNSIKRDDTKSTSSISKGDKKNQTISRTNSLKNPSPILEQKTQPNLQKTVASGSSPTLDAKNASVSRTNSLKKANTTTTTAVQKPSTTSNNKENKIAPAMQSKDKMQIENILGIVKKVDGKQSAALLKSKETDDKDIGKMLYDVESKADRRMSDALKQIEAKNFAGTMDTIRSQMVMPTVSSQAMPSSVDLAKYFPNQKAEKVASAATNKNQKTLKDVDLAKYFPTSPVPQRRSSVLTVAEKLKKSKTEKALAGAAAAATIKAPPRRQKSLGGAGAAPSAGGDFSLRDHQMDGAVDLTKKKSATTVVTAATATTTKRGNVKIIRRIVPKGTKAKKAAEAAAATAAAPSKSTEIVRDESDRIFDEILNGDDDQEVRSPSSEYQKLFKEEKSPSEDISDKIERILEETGIDLGIPRRTTDHRKKLIKTKSLGEDEFERTHSQLFDTTKEDGDYPSRGGGVQSILKRFESMSSVKSDRKVDDGLKKSRDSMQSRDSLQSKSDSMSDLEKTMEYLKAEWQNEASNFLQKKRDSFYSKKRLEAVETATQEEKEKKAKYEEPQYKQTKYAKFFGIKPKQKSPEKMKSPTKSASSRKKTPEKTVVPPQVNQKKSPAVSSDIRKTPSESALKNSMGEIVQGATSVVPQQKKSSAVSSDIKKTPIETALKNSMKEMAQGEKTVVPPQVNQKKSPALSSDIKKTPTETALKNSMEEMAQIGSIRRASVDLAKSSNSTGRRDTLIPSGKLCDASKTSMDELAQIGSRRTSIESPKPSEIIALIEKRRESLEILPKMESARKESTESLKNLLPPSAGSPRRKSIDSLQNIDTYPIGDRIKTAESVSNLQQEPPIQIRKESLENLPKFGCKKASENNSRRGSQGSINNEHNQASCSSSRRQSTTESLQKAADSLVISSAKNMDDLLFDEIVSELPDIAQHKGTVAQQNVAEFDQIFEEDISDLPTTVSDRELSQSSRSSRAAQPVAVQLRGSSEEESIEKLFSHFTDDMLVNVEFDSNDELLAITPRCVLTKEDSGADNTDNPSERLESLERDLSPLFPVRPQRRQKSTSSSSDASIPIAPMRAKKAIAKIDPKDIAPSVQDFLHQMFARKEQEEQLLRYQSVSDAVPLKFPRKFDEDDVIVLRGGTPESKANSLRTELQELDVSREPSYGQIPVEKLSNVVVNEHQEDLKVSATTTTPPISSRKSSTESRRNSTQTELEMEQRQALIRRDDAYAALHSQSNSLHLESYRRKSLDSLRSNEKTTSTPEFSGESTQLEKTGNSKENSVEWDMSKIPNSVKNSRESSVDRRRGRQQSTPDTIPKITTPPPALSKSKEKSQSLEWDMEKIPKSPMPRRKFANNLDEAINTSQLKIMQELELERRQALIRRDEAYAAAQESQVKQENTAGDSQLKIFENRPWPNPNSPTSSQRKISNQSQEPAKKESPKRKRKTSLLETPPRKNSSHDLGRFDADSTPLPKVLLPDLVQDEINCQRIKESKQHTTPLAGNREWHKLDSTDVTDGIDHRPLSPTFDYRPWPKLQSQSPELRRKYSPDAKRKISSNSTSDLTGSPKLPYSQLHHHHHHLYQPSHSNNRESFGTSSAATSVSRSMEHITMPMRPNRSSKHEQPPVDTGTRILLDRSKRLHNLKRDFMEERMANRNPYMKKFLDEEKLSRDDDDDNDDNDELESYRPKNHTITQKFPTSRAIADRRGGGGARYDYGSDISNSSSRRMHHTLPDRHHNGGGATLSTSAYGGGVSRHTNFTDYFKRSPSHHKEREHSKDSCVQSDSESTSSNAVEHNSATEISTDSEFDHDEIIRETPKIFIDDTHLRKPTKVQIKSTVIAPHSGQKFHTTTAAAVATTTNNNHTGSINMNNNQQNHPRHGYGNTRQREQPQFKPLVQVDPSLLTSNRMPLQNPRQGDYLLNKTASTEGIASKKSLELKKRYLLGEQANGNKIQKSGSTSVLDSKFRSFHSNISECQKLLNPSSDISPSIKTFLDHRAKPGDNNACNGGGSFVATSDSCSNAIQGGLGELNEKIEITIQKPALDSTAVDEKENVFVNSKNELNKGMEYSETINTTLVESMSKQHKCTSLSSPPIIETIDLITPEKVVPIIDLTQVKIPSKMLESNMEFIRNMQTSSDAADVTMKSSGTDDTTKDNSTLLTTADSNKIIDLTLLESPLKSEKTIMADSPTPPTVDKPDVSKDVKETIPDIIEHIEEVAKADKLSSVSPTEDQQKLLSSDQDEEKKDSPEKDHPSENDILHETSIQVPNIPWNNRRKHRTESESLSSTGSSGSSSASSTSSSVEDIQHYILDSTTSPETQTNHMVPRLEVHDSSGTLMQIDSLMIIDGKYVGDPEDLKLMEIPEGIIVPEMPASEDDKTATPEPPQRAAFVSESAKPLPQKTPSPPTTKPDLRFDTKNENKVDTLKNLPLIVDRMVDHSKVIKPLTLSINKAANVVMLPIIDNDKTPTADLQASSKGGGSDSETEVTGQVLTETELSDWTADDCISENFIDMEFVLNSNKGTIKRNKKAKKKNSSKLPTPKEAAATPSNAVECEGILKNLDIDEIEFMDTGSEGSCAESYSATNTALLRNRGYVEFVDNTNPSHNAPPTYHITSSSSLGSSPYHYYHTPTRSRHQPPPLSSSYQYNNYSPVREVLGIDYIEQGAYIMQNIDYDLKTPVNESPLPTNVTGMLFPATATSKSQHKSLDSPSAPLSSSSSEKVHQSPPTPPTTEGTNDLDDDSVCVLTNSQGAATMSANSATNTATTTEESEALTVVTSPLDSFSPKTQEIFNQTTGGGGGSGSSPSSSDKNPKTSTSSPTTTSSSKMPARKLSREEAAVTSIAETPSAQQHKAPQTTSHKEVAADEMSYGDYVRKLQQKITQISNARDSIDVRKQKRKSSKGEPTSDTSSVIENNKAGASSSLRGHAEESGAPSKGHFDDMSYNPPSSPITNLAQVVGAAANTSNNSSSTVHKVPEIPTLTRKLEEITKERTKQKDLIHDLVMDKLQSKKQLNAEKRLTRSRNRSLFGCSAGGGTSVAGGCSTKATVVNGANCTNAPHYHQASSVDRGVAYSGNRNNPSKKSTSPKETKEVVKIFSETVAAAVKPSPPRSSSNKQRPFSENIDPDHHLFDAKLYKLSKTQSFSSYSTVAAATNNRNHYTTHKDDVVFATPVTTAARANRAASRQNSEENAAALTASTEKLRTEARARARLKSNHDLGLSPEEKLQVLRKRYHLEMQQVGTDRDGSKKSPEHQLPPYHYHHHHQHFNNQKPVTGVNDRKMISSKSVNDIASAQLSQLHSNENSNMKGSCGNLTGAADFTSDPNLSQANTARQPTISSNKTNRRHKDPERRKSIIQTFSSFFQKGSKNKDGTTTTATTTATAASAANSAQSERPATSGSCTATATPAEGVFSRFRISPKSREKSKDKDGSPTASCSTTPQHHHNHHHHHHNHQQQHHQQQQHQQQLAQLLHDHHHDQYHERSNSQDCVAKKQKYQMSSSHSSASSPQLFKMNANEEPTPPPIPPLPLNYQRSDDESNATESRDQKKQRAISKAIRQAELKRLRIAQEIQREQEEIEVQLKELEARGVFIEKALRGEGQNLDNVESSNVGAASDEKLLKELLEIWRNITQLKKRDEELGIRQQELQLEHRHAQLKEELNIRLSGSKLEKSSADVAAEGAILNEMLEIVSKRAALRPTSSPSTVVIAGDDLMATSMLGAAAAGATQATDIVIDNCLTLNARQSNEIDESDI